MRTSRRAFLAGATAFLATPVVRASAQAVPVSLKVDIGPWGAHAAIYYAQQKGWFSEAGLNVDIQDGTGSLNTINLVGAGRVDVGYVQLGPMAIGRAGGLPVKSFAGFMRRGDLGVMVDAKTGPTDPKQLAGKKIMCFAASPWAPFIDGYLAHAGLKRGTGAGEVNVVMVSPQAMASTYASGAADGFMSIQPYGEPLVAATRPARSLLAVDAGIHFPSYGLIASDETLSKRADVLGRLAQVQQRAWAELAQSPGAVEEGAKAIIAGRPNAQLDPVVILDQAKLCLNFLQTSNTSGKPQGWQTEADWKGAIASMTEVGVLKGDFKPSDFYTNDLLKA